MRGALALVVLAGCARTPAAAPPVTSNRVEPAAAVEPTLPLPALATRPLTERCAVAKLLALQTVDVLSWQNKLADFVENNRAYLVVFVGGDTRLIADGETCPTVPIRSTPLEVVLLGTQVTTSAWYLALWLDQDDASPGTYRFEWPRSRFYRGSAPPPPGQPSINSHTMTSGAGAPTLVFELAFEDGYVSTEKADVRMMRRNVNLP